MKTLADLSPELQAFFLGLVGFVAKSVLDSAIKAFKNTLDTPARVTALEQNFKNEIDGIKDWKPKHESSIERNWTKFQDLEKRIEALERGGA